MLVPASFALSLALLAASGATVSPPRPASQTTPPDVLTPGDNLVVDGLPPIPADLARGLSPYQNMRSASFLDWSPSGDGLIILTRFAQTAQVHHVPFPGGRRTQLTFFPERVSSARFVPRGDGRHLLLSMDRGGNERYQLHWLDLRTGHAALLTDGTSRNQGVIWDRAGTRVAFASTQRNGRDFDIWLLDPQRPSERRLLMEAEGLWTPLDFSPDGKWLLVQNYVSINESRLYLVETATGERRPLLAPSEETASHPDARFSPDGKRVYFTSDHQAEHVRLFSVDLSAKKAAPVVLTAHVPWDVTDFDVSDDGKRIAFATNEGGPTAIRVIDPSGKPAGKQPRLPMGVAGGIRFQPGSHQFAFSLTGPRTPGDVYSFDARKGRLERWTYSETGGLDASAFAEPEIIAYETFDTVAGAPRKIPALLYLPPRRSASPLPVLINIHGGPEGQSRPRFLGSANHRLNELGMAVIYPNVRGSAGYGKSYLKLDNGRLREDSVRDIGALLDWITTRKDLDSTRVAVMGGSYGGFMSLASLVRYGDRLRCGISYVGISNFVTFLENTEAYRRDLRRAEYGDERDPEMRAFLQRISPLTQAEAIRVPLLVIQGANDPRVPASESDQIVAQVRKQGGEVWYLLAKDEGHGFVKKANADYADLAITMFLRRCFEKPSP